jgi:hypothetical protein
VTGSRAAEAAYVEKAMGVSAAAVQARGRSDAAERERIAARRRYNDRLWDIVEDAGSEGFACGFFFLRFGVFFILSSSRFSTPPKKHSQALPRHRVFSSPPLQSAPASLSLLSSPSAPRLSTSEIIRSGLTVVGELRQPPTHYHRKMRAPQRQTRGEPEARGVNFATDQDDDED